MKMNVLCVSHEIALVSYNHALEAMPPHLYPPYAALLLPSFLATLTSGSVTVCR